MNKWLFTTSICINTTLYLFVLCQKKIFCDRVLVAGSENWDNFYSRRTNDVDFIRIGGKKQRHSNAIGKKNSIDNRDNCNLAQI